MDGQHMQAGDQLSSTTFPPDRQKEGGVSAQHTGNKRRNPSTSLKKYRCDRNHQFKYEKLAVVEEPSEETQDSSNASIVHLRAGRLNGTPAPQQAGQMATPSAGALSLASFAASLCLPLGDADACRSLVMQDLQQLDDSVEFLIVGHRVKEDAKLAVGPPRHQYESPGKISPALHERTVGGSVAGGAQGLFEKRPAGVTGDCTIVSKNGVSFDWLVALGCLNCGAPIELRRDLLAAAEEALAAAAAAPEGKDGASAAEKAFLRCRRCGHIIAPLHSSTECESLVDRMQLKAEAAPRLPSGGVYMFGSRKSYNFGSVGKQAWQQRFLGAEFQEQQLQHHLKIMLAAEEGGGKATCNEVCEKCGHKETFFSTFQARSADEGMTVMYECTKCHHRWVFNN
ncbi:hypothetical protein Efla_005893 [Eimeria flavescens]